MIRMARELKFHRNIEVDRGKENPPKINTRKFFVRVEGDTMPLMFIGTPPRKKGLLYGLEVVRVGRGFAEFMLVEINRKLIK